MTNGHNNDQQAQAHDYRLCELEDCPRCGYPVPECKMLDHLDLHREDDKMWASEPKEQK